MIVLHSRQPITTSSQRCHVIVLFAFVMAGVASATLLSAQQAGGSPVSSAGPASNDHLSTLPAAASAVELRAFRPRPARSGYEAQIALARRGISPGVIDGIVGPQTRAALRALQRVEGIAVTGELDLSTREALRLLEPPERTYIVTSQDLARLQPLGATWIAKSQQSRLEYETILELVSEAGQAHPSLVRSLNPAVDWETVTAGTEVTIPNAQSPPARVRAAWLHLRLSERVLQAFDDRTNIIAHFPCSIARRVEKRPLGLLFVEKVAANPIYRFDPANFPESAEAQRVGRRLSIPAGPNSPVGTAWIGLNRLGYGIHGTPRPELVGRTESHGCFRLSNWNAEYLAHLVRVGTPVLVDP